MHSTKLTTPAEVIRSIADDITAYGHYRGSLRDPEAEMYWPKEKRGKCCLLANPTNLSDVVTYQNLFRDASPWDKAYDALRELAERNGFYTITNYSDDTDTDTLLADLRSLATRLETENGVDNASD